MAVLVLAIQKFRGEFDPGMVDPMIEFPWRGANDDASFFNRGELDIQPPNNEQVVHFIPYISTYMQSYGCFQK